LSNAKNAKVTTFLICSVYPQHSIGALYGKLRFETRLPICAGI